MININSFLLDNNFTLDSCLSYLEKMSNITQCSNVSDPDFVFGIPETLAAGSSATLLGILGLLSNLITICALLLHAPIRNHVTTPFVISLAFSDLLFSSTILPLLAIKFFSQ